MGTRFWRCSRRRGAARENVIRSPGPCASLSSLWSSFPNLKRLDRPTSLLLHTSHTAARMDATEDIATLKAQDRWLWREDLTAKTQVPHQQAVISGRIGSHTILTTIASVQTRTTVPGAIRRFRRDDGNASLHDAGENELQAGTSPRRATVFRRVRPGVSSDVRIPSRRAAPTCHWPARTPRAVPPSRRSHLVLDCAARLGHA